MFIVAYLSLVCITAVHMQDRVYTVHSSMAVAAYEWSAVPDGATKLPFTLTPLPANSSSSSVRKLGGGAVTNSVSVTMSNSNSSSSSNVSVSETDYSGEGVPAVSSCCFGIVVGSKSRRTTGTTSTTTSSNTSATTNTTTSSDSSSVSDRLVSCGYWDNSVRVHSLTTDSKSSSSSGAAYTQQCCAAEGVHIGVVTCLSASDGGLMVT
jgi:hypothetical protein